MFANCYTAFIDACSLAGVLKRNLLLTLAEAEFFRIRWSAEVLDETECAIARMLRARGVAEPEKIATLQRARMEDAFADAMVSDFDTLLSVCTGLPDQEDAHVIAAALKTQAATIVTDSLKHFTPELLSPLNMEARSTDAFIADTIALDPGRAVAAIRQMRERFKKPEMTPEDLLIAMEAQGLTNVVDILRAYVQSL